MIWGAVVGGLVGTLVLTTMLRAASELGLTRMDIPFLLGTAVTENRVRAKAVGYVLHFVFGLLFASATGRSSSSSTSRASCWEGCSACSTPSSLERARQRPAPGRPPPDGHRLRRGGLLSAPRAARIHAPQLRTPDADRDRSRAHRLRRDRRRLRLSWAGTNAKAKLTPGPTKRHRAGLGGVLTKRRFAALVLMMATLETTASAPADRERLLALGAALVTVTLWASAFVGIRDAARPSRPARSRSAGCRSRAVALGLIVLWPREPLPSRRDLGVIAFVGVFWFGLYNIALNEAEQRVDAGTAAMLVNVGPILIAVLAGLILHEGFPPRLIAGMAIAFAGVIVIGSATSDGGLTPSWGALLCLAAAVGYAVGVVAQKPVLTRVSAIQMTWLACTFGALVCLPFAGTLGSELPDVPRRRSAGWSTSRSRRWPSASSPGATRWPARRPAGWAR